MKAPPDFNFNKEDQALHNYLNSVPPLETNKYIGASFNSLAMDSSLPDDVFSSYLPLYHESLVPMRNNPLDTSMPELFSEDANKIHPNQEPDKVIPTEDYSHDLFGIPIPKNHPLFSSDALYYRHDFFGMPIPNGTNVGQIEGGNYIQQVGQIEANIQVPGCDGKNITSKMQSLTLMDRSQIERWNDETVCIGRHLQGLALDRQCLENNMTIKASSIGSYTAKFDEWNASNNICGSTWIMPFQDLTNKQLNPPNLKRKRNDQIDLGDSCLTHENHEESASFCQSIPKKKMKIHNSNPTWEVGACNKCNCKKSQCLKLYCECFAAGVYCTGPCSCQNCLNKAINEDKVMEARKKIVPKVEDPNKGGCNCNKSNCMKKYCECFKAGVGCSPSCNCRGCENIHGRKDRLDSEAETKSYHEETEAFFRNRSIF